MEEKGVICQSCGMPLKKDEDFGTNQDGTKSPEFCSFCYVDGKFIDEGITMDEKINKLIFIATTKLGIPEESAKEMSNNLIPKLKRWKNNVK